MRKIYDFGYKELSISGNNTQVIKTLKDQGENITEIIGFTMISDVQISKDNLKINGKPIALIPMNVGGIQRYGLCLENIKLKEIVINTPCNIQFWYYMI